jgi:DNA repair protein RadC
VAQASLAELGPVQRIARRWAVQLGVVVELSRRLFVGASQDRPQVKSPANAANLVRLDVSLLDPAPLRGILLDTRHPVPAIEMLSQGKVNTTVIRTGELH